MGNEDACGASLISSTWLQTLVNITWTNDLCSYCHMADYFPEKSRHLSVQICLEVTWKYSELP